MPRFGALQVIAASIVLASPSASAFQFPNIPFLSAPAKSIASTSSPSLTQKKEELLSLVSNTENGKTAAPPLQAKVLSIVREIEMLLPFGSLSDPNEAKALDGTWYLQYTSPSQLEDEEGLLDTWTPVDPVEFGIDKTDKEIETKQFTAKGTVSAVGITVDTSNRIVKQIFNNEDSTVANEINFEWGTLTVRGPFKPSDKVDNRAIVAFKELLIEPNNLPTINLSFLFAAIKNIKGSDVGGWLETTYLSGDDLRIGRGNKGTMFVLTRDPNAVKP